MVAEYRKTILAAVAALCLCGQVWSADIKDYPDNLGKEFHLMFLENALYTSKTKSLPLVLFITNPNEEQVSVTIETPGFLNAEKKPRYKETKTIAAGTVESFEVPANLRVVGTTQDKKAVVIKGSGAIAVTGSNQEQFSTGAFLGLPLDVLDKEYYALCWHTPKKKCQIGVASPSSNNKVEITVGPNGEIEYNSKTYGAGATFSATLGQYDTLQLQSSKDLTGTLIKASAKVSVFSGNIKVGIMPTANSPIDHVVEMIMPVSRWGKDFITSPIPERTTGDAFTFVAGEDDTEITIYGPTKVPKKYKIAKKGGSLTRIISSKVYALVKSNKAIMVAQFVLSQRANVFGTNTPSSEAADPAMVMIPPIQQYAADYTVSTLTLKRSQNSKDYTNYFLLAVKEEDKDGIMVDGKRIDTLQVKWTAIPGTKYVGTSLKVTSGVHRVYHQNPTKTYTGILYGFFNAEAYAFPTGFRMAPINPCVKTKTSLEGDGVDNDCDGLIDEEFCYEDGIKADDDGDGLIDEDCVKIPANYIRPVAFIGNSTTKNSATIKFNPPTKGPKPDAYEFYGYLTSKGYKTNRLVKTLYNNQATEYVFTFTGLSPDTQYTFIVAARLNGSQARADNSITVKTLAGDAVIADPKLTVQMNKAKTELEFVLTVAPLKDNSLRYAVTWYSMGTILQVKLLSGSQTTSILEQRMLRKRGPGMTVYAEVYSCHRITCQNRSPTKRTNVWTPKITVSTKSLTVVEGSKEAEVKFRSNAPPILLCNNTAGACSSVRVQAYQVSTGREFMRNGKAVMQAVIMHKDVEVSRAFCGVEITSGNWFEEMSIFVKAKMDGLYDGTQTRTLAVEWVQQVTANNAVTVTRTALERVQMTVTDMDSRAVCHSLCDPHIRTFDGISYDNHFEGEFVLYKHKTKPYAIHAMYTKCLPGSRVTCNCGVAVQVGDDVIVVDSCSKTRGPLALTIYKNGDLTPGTKVYNPHTKYEIHLPTGAVVTVVPVRFGAYTHINIYIKPSVMDVSNSEGLCGDFNKKNTDDFIVSDGSNLSQRQGNLRPKFSSYWRVQKEGSIFNGVCASRAAIKKSVFCDCTGDPKTERCHSGIEAMVFNTASTGARDLTDSLVKNSREPKPYIKCGTPDTVDETAEIVMFDTEDRVDLTVSKTWTEEKARAYCDAFMKKNPSVARCAAVMQKTDFEDMINNCIKDILSTDTTDWALAARESIKQLCTFELKANVKLWTEVNGKLAFPAAIANLICDNDCNGRGTCKDGKCVCQAGFIGDDCMIKADVAPVINKIDIAPCNKNVKGSVTRATLFGVGFARTKTLACLAQTVTRTAQRTIQVGPMIKTAAVFMSNRQVACEMKSCSDFYVAVGNDEKVLSEKVQAVTDETLVKKARLKTVIAGKKMNFECLFDVDGKASTLYTVHWYNKDVRIKTSAVSGDETGNATLSEDDLTERGYGTTVQCRVVACEKASCDATKGVVVMSNVYTAKIRMGNKDITVIESGKEEMVEFNLKASPGILCPHKNATCSYRVVAVQHLGKQDFKCANRYPISQAVIGFDGELKDAICGTRIDVDDWANVHRIAVKAKADGRIDGAQTRKFTFYLYVSAEVAGVKLDKEERIPISSLQVKVEDRDKSATCKCVNDPHITTFDGSYYNNHMEGEFVLYKHESVPQAVHMFFKKCVGVGSNRASCNCAAAIKSGDDVIVFDGCDNKRKKKKVPTATPR